MMKGKELLCISLAAVCLAGTVSCSKDYTGRYIRIQGSTQPHAGATKTAYSDVTYTESAATYERIDWVSGDKILLAMKNDGGTEQLAYSITGIKSSSNRYSKATLVPDGVASGLQWGDGTHYFWSAYPSTATVGNDMTVRGSYPATQTLTYRTEADNVKYFDPDMNMAYMVASLSTPPQDYISLDYYPAMTTFDFEVGANDNIVITGFEMETETSGLTSDVDLTGTFVATFDPASSMAWTFTTDGATGKKITASFPQNISVSQTKKARFKLFALPKDITGVRIKFTLSTGVTKSLNLKQNDSWITFPACIKANISGLLIPDAVWHITFSGPREEQWIVNSDIEIGVE